VIALILTFIIYIVTKALSFRECVNSLTAGFRSMVPAILILIFAWTLSGIMGAKGGYLDAQAFVEANMSDLASSGLATALIPAIFFLIACGISFATGTSWGTFGILIPVATSILGTGLEPNVILAISAILAGSVYGDHVSPISDTTIMASSGAQCNHIDHVKTQLPYATVCAAIAFVSYLIAGVIVSIGIGYAAAATVTLSVGLVLLAILILVLWLAGKKKKA
jgi:Na+/H+ antiporter NhaC